MVSTIDIPEEVTRRVSNLRLHSFWADASGAMWVAADVGEVDYSHKFKTIEQAPPGTFLAQIGDLGLATEGRSLSDAEIAILECHVGRFGQ